MYLHTIGKGRSQKEVRVGIRGHNQKVHSSFHNFSWLQDYPPPPFSHMYNKYVRPDNNIQYSTTFKTLS